MSKADYYRDELVPEVEEQLVAGVSLGAAITYLTLLYDDISPDILESWVLRKYGSEEDLQEWAAAKRDSIENTASKFAELKKVIELTPLEKLSHKLVPQFTEWHKWIQKNAWSNPDLRAEALAFAKNEIWRRRAIAAVGGVQ